MSSLVTMFAYAAHQLPEVSGADQDMTGLPLSIKSMTPQEIALIVTAAVNQFRQRVDQKNKEREFSTKELLQLSLKQYIESLDQQIEGMEAGFKSRFGDAWLEQIALRVMDEDTIPLQQDGETIEEYRARLKATLIDEMLNPDGTIKDRYKDHPEYGQYAQWAQAVYNRDRAIELANDVRNNPNSPAIQYLEEQQNAELTIYTARGLDGHDDKKEAALNVEDNIADIGTQENQSNFSNSFLKPIGS